MIEGAEHIFNTADSIAEYPTIRNCPYSSKIDVLLRTHSSDSIDLEDQEVSNIVTAKQGSLLDIFNKAHHFIMIVNLVRNMIYP